MDKLATLRPPKVNFYRIARTMDKVFQELDQRQRAYAPLANEVSGAYGTDVGAALEEVFKSLCQLVDAHAALKSNLSTSLPSTKQVSREKSQARSLAKLVRAHKKLMKLRQLHKQ